MALGETMRPAWPDFRNVDIAPNNPDGSGASSNNECGVHGSDNDIWATFDSTLYENPDLELDDAMAQHYQLEQVNTADATSGSTAFAYPADIEVVVEQDNTVIKSEECDNTEGTDKHLLPKKKPTRFVGIQTRVIVLKRAYKDTDRHHIKFPHTFQNAQRMSAESKTLQQTLLSSSKVRSGAVGLSNSTYGFQFAPRHDLTPQPIGLPLTVPSPLRFTRPPPCRNARLEPDGLSTLLQDVPCSPKTPTRLEFSSAYPTTPVQPQAGLTYPVTPIQAFSSPAPPMTPMQPVSNPAYPTTPMQHVSSPAYPMTPTQSTPSSAYPMSPKQPPPSPAHRHRRQRSQHISIAAPVGSSRPIAYASYRSMPAKDDNQELLDLNYANFNGDSEPSYKDTYTGGYNNGTGLGSSGCNDNSGGDLAEASMGFELNTSWAFPNM